MPDYANGKIYKIVCNITGEQYIGGTIQKLSQRLTTHVVNKNKNNGCKSKNIILRGDYQIVLIENYPCDNKEELAKKEREHIEANICVNKNIPTRTREEYIETNRELISLYHKNNYIAHKEAIDLRNKKYMDTHKEEQTLRAKAYYNTHKELIGIKHKEWRDTHKDYYNTNKDEINRKRRERRANKKKQEKIEEVKPMN